ncbi:uncharacterized protein PG986_013788 [Apiospora aurea]|uniref:Uncharacterized protein n=1 Tax=Apiospora aurea TaxID=335848 RepID=A0ABR1PWI9_9PEZI
MNSVELAKEPRFHYTAAQRPVTSAAYRRAMEKISGVMSSKPMRSPLPERRGGVGIAAGAGRCTAARASQTTDATLILASRRNGT